MITFEDMRKPSEIPSVSAFTRQIKDLLEGTFSAITVGGEVSQPVRSRNGHLYFTLKDEGAQISCVVWRSTLERMRADLQHGQQINVHGDVVVYAPAGRYQIVVRSIEQAGEGALQAAFERLKARLASEGLFEPQRKRALPEFPKVIGVVTSESGAAFQDIRSTLQRRYPLARVLLYHAAVQGVGAAAQIVQGIQWFSGHRNPPDVLIVGRGGGSLEDLWPFNEEAVARAIAGCTIPVVSAVGHETDFSIADFVADVRAATPTQAAVLVCPDVQDLKFQNEALSARAERSVRQRVISGNETIRKMVKTHALLAIRDKLTVNRERIKRYRDQITGSVTRQLQTSTDRLERAGLTLKPTLQARITRLNENLTGKQRALKPAVSMQLIRGQQSLMKWSAMAAPLVQSGRQQRFNAWQNLHYRLGALNPTEPLERGFARIMQGDQWIRRREALNENEPLTVEWKDGRIRR
ncbi:MAG: exodeoxyribonuclease VII large subunit XseA [Bacteroidetes bacterium HLUCCA01]|nr:MAG: exodeoxyribonuclease VII large subunit XseA [Bacteroidetes bacterium HLUCCA01]